MYNFVLENVLLQYYFTLYTFYMRQFGFYCVLFWNTNSVLFTVRRLADICILFMVPNKQVSVCTTCRTPVYRSMLYSQFIPSFVMYIHRSIIYSCFQYSPSMARKNNTHTHRDERTNVCHIPVAPCNYPWLWKLCCSLSSMHSTLYRTKKVLYKVYLGTGILWLPLLCYIKLHKC